MPVKKGPNCVGDEMHRWKHTGMHSGTGKKGKEGKLVPYPGGQKQAVAIALSVCGKGKKKTSDHAEYLMGLGYSEETANAVAKIYDFVTAEEEADKGPLSDTDATPGKQKGNSGRQKQPQQGMASGFPTSKNQPSAPGQAEYDEGPMVKAKGRTCPPGTQAVGSGFCKNSKPGKTQYFDIEKGKSCPPGSRTAGKGRCRVDFAEPAQPDLTGTCGQKEKREKRAAQQTPAEKAAAEQRGREMQGKASTVPPGVRQEAAKNAAETRAKCDKLSGSKNNATQNNATQTSTSTNTSPSTGTR